MPSSKEKKAIQQKALRQRNRDVDDFPTVAAAWKRKRAAAGKSLRLFCLTFFGSRFYLPFSADHVRVIDQLERIVREGGLLALAMPRGSGKTELVKAAALWAILYGYRRFVVVVGATAADALRVMEDIKVSLEHNDEVHAAFPEATHCIRQLEGIVQAAKVQTIDGERSGLEWTRASIRLAWVSKKKCPQVKCSGAVIRTAGLTGAIRGMSAAGPDGETIRPDLVLLDDPQDRESATSPSQTDDRERIVRGDVLGLAGPTKSIAAIMPCTVICENDLADRLLNREVNPQWNGERTRLVESFPTNADLWDQYFAMRADALRAGNGARPHTEFYKSRRAEMDAGCVLAWPERFDPARYTSAVEEAMCRRHDDPEAFAAEMQNAPARASDANAEVRELKAADLEQRLTSFPRGVVPREATRLTAMVDVGGKILWWAVVAWDERYNGAVIDYGTYPRQSRHYFTAADAAPTLIDLYPGRTEGQRVHAGLKSLAGDLLSRAWPRDGGGDPHHVGLCLVDAHWGPGGSEVVHQAIRESPQRSAILPSVGYSTANNARGMDDWQMKEGERAGPSWRLGPKSSGRRQLTFDPDFWKSFTADRLSTDPGSGGCLRFFGSDPREHRLLADHLTAEYAVRVTARGRTFDRWDMKPGGRDNHWLDVLTGAAVAASVLGLAWSAGEGLPRPLEPRQKIRLSELYAQKHGKRG